MEIKVAYASDIPFDSNAKYIEERLQTEVPGFEDTTVSIKQYCAWKHFDISGGWLGGDMETIQVHSQNLTGPQDIFTSIFSSVTRTRYPISGDMLRLAYEKPQVEVFVNGYPSKCVGSCQFETSETVTPVARTILPNSGSAYYGTILVVHGSNLDSTGETPSVIEIGGKECFILSSNQTVITCKVPEVSVGIYEVSINIGGKGFAKKKQASTSLLFIIEGLVSSIAPISGYASGGTEVTIRGSGFSSNTSFNFASSTCKVISFNTSVITCLTPESSSSGNITVIAIDGSDTIGTLQFTYLPADAEVFSISPTSTTVNGGRNLTLTGVNIGKSKSLVYVGDRICDILDYTPTQIVCRLPSAAPGMYHVRVLHQGKGYANSSSSISYILRVDNISPLIGSQNGGNEVTITGSGFVDDATTVKIGESFCKIKALNATQIKCTTQPVTSVHFVTNSGNHKEFGVGFNWNTFILSIQAGDTVVWRWAFSSITTWHKGARIFTIKNSTSENFDGIGFESSPVGSLEGTFSYTFNRQGTYYVSTGDMRYPQPQADTSLHSLAMKQAIIVKPAPTISHPISVLVGKHEADYNADNASIDVNNSCARVEKAADCDIPKTKCTKEFLLVTSDCYTPKISSISYNVGYKDTRMVIKGKGFSSSNCGNEVLIGAGEDGGYNCDVVSSSDEEIQCDISPRENASFFTAYQVSVNVAGVGISSFMNNTDTKQRFTLLPSISSINPSLGSVYGGSLITITGSGFTSRSLVYFGDYSRCSIHSVSLFEIQCYTGPTDSGLYNVSVNIGSYFVECIGACEFTFTNSSTPIITNVSPVTVVGPNTELTLNGILLEGEVLVKIGSETCDVKRSSDTYIICTLGELLAGDHILDVMVSGKGKAKLEMDGLVISSRLLITSMSPKHGSEMGGTVVNFKGNGFKTTGTSVVIGNSICNIMAETLTNFEMDCITSQGHGNQSVSISNIGNSSGEIFTFLPSSTPEIVAVSPTAGEPGTVITITGSLFNASDMEIVIGDSKCLNITGNETQVTCQLGNYAGGKYVIHSTVQPFGHAPSNVEFGYSFSILHVHPPNGSFAGGNIITIEGTGFSNVSEVMVCERKCEYGPHIAGTGAAYNKMMCRISELTENITVDSTCSILVRVNGQSARGEELYTFTTNQTPIITGIFPTRGGTQGGTEVIIFGSRFDADLSNVNVGIGGVACNVTSSNNTCIKCITDAQGASVRADIKVTINGKGLALNQGIQFYYTDVWSSPYTWGGNPPPVAGDFIVVPEGQTLVIDEDTPVLKMLLIQGGIVIFDDRDIHLQAENILLTDGGLLQIGTEDKPFQHQAIITLHGHVRSQEIPIYGTKSIGVRNGTLDLRGMPIPMTWVHLKETAVSGSSTISLGQPVRWKVGDEIVLASTGNQYLQNENEKHVIISISSDGETISLSDSLKYTHISFMEKFGDVNVETRGEVGLLTRNIVIQGSSYLDRSIHIETGDMNLQDLFREDEEEDQFGGHIMIHPRSLGLNVARVKMEYVELRNMGQAFHLERYPINFNVLGDVHFDSYIRGCSIHKSFNRAIGIHNTHHLLIEHNVIYDIMGGAVCIEEGFGHGNQIEYNLVVFCKQSTSLLNVDITPAAFLVTNPKNTFQHNAVAGGTHLGFWYHIPDRFFGTEYICPQNYQLGMFANNTVHSQGWFGLWIFQAYTPKYIEQCFQGSVMIAQFHSLKVWNCEKGAEVVDIGAIQFVNPVMTHNKMVGIEAKTIIDKYMHWGDVGVYNATITAHSAGLSEGASYRGIVLPLGPGFEVNGATFINFHNNSVAAIEMTSVDGLCTVDCGGWDVKMAGTAFINSPNKAAFRWEHETVLLDVDGSLSGTADSFITPYNPTLPSTCSELQGFDVGSHPGAQCEGGVRLHRVSWNRASPSHLNERNVILSNKYGNTSLRYRTERLTHNNGWMGTMLDGEIYKWSFEGHNNTNISYDAIFYDFQEGDCIIVGHEFDRKPDNIILAGDAQSEMVTCSNNSNGDYFFDQGSLTLYYVVSYLWLKTPQRWYSTSPYVGGRHIGVLFEVSFCFYKDCITPPSPELQPPAWFRPSTVQIWHNRNFWRIANGEYIGGIDGDGSTSIPPDNQDIRIEKGAWMIVKEDLPRIRKLFIDGVLEIDWEDSTLDVTLSAAHIVVTGGRLIVGWEDSIFQGNLNIILRGDRQSPDIISQQINMGPKVIGVIGGLDLHGKDRSPHSTHLANALRPGENAITLEDSPSDWVSGDEIVIATTGGDPSETETFKIVSVNGSVVTLNDTAKFEHLAESFNLSIDGYGPSSYEIRAEVAMLTRNIKVYGEDYGDMAREAFGARIYITAAGDYRGFARLSNVEFYNSGQKDVPTSYETRFSLAFSNTGEVTDLAPSFVRKNTFHNCFNSAIGVLGASRFNVSDNVVHDTYGSGIRVEGSNNRVEGNLVMLTRASGSSAWVAGIQVNAASDLTLSNNAVVGSERAGYRIDGHDCSPYSTQSNSIEWGWNTARATLHGIYMNQDGFRLCTSITKFKIHNAYDHGIYYEGVGSLMVSDVLITDSGFAIAPIIYSPRSVIHAFQDKRITIERSTIVAVSSPGYCPTLSDNSYIVRGSGSARATLRDGATRLARTGILWPTFNSKPTSSPFVASRSYPAIGGRTEIQGVAFVNFDDATCSSDNTVILTNALAEDFLHPVYTSQLQFINSSESSRIYFHRPSVSSIRLAECGDMECDGLKKALLVDRDGSMVGGSGGSIIPQAEFEWNGDLSRGLGDYKIPKAMLTRQDGSKIPVDEIAPDKGILRANSSTTTCINNNQWQGHKCTGYRHGILVIESLDADSETRKLSPVALLADKYVDLNNGPKNHESCERYTCYRRLSTFWTIVALNKTYDLYLTGTSPEKLRLRILNEDNDAKMVVRLFSKRPQRLDVYTDDRYVLPLNGEYDENGKSIVLQPTAPGQYVPTVNNHAGANFFDRTEQMIHVTLAGSNVVEIHEAEVVVLTFNMPAVTPDEFFDNRNLVNNLALFLNIPPSKIRIVNAVREDSARRRKRTTGPYAVTVEIGNTVEDSINTTAATNVTSGNDTSLSYEDLVNVTSTVTNALQENTLSEALGTEVSSLSVVDVRATTTSNATTTNATESETDSVSYFVPAGIRIVQQPNAGFASQLLSPVLKVAGIDVGGNDIILGHISDPWIATATIIQTSQTGAYLSETLAFFNNEDGHAEFGNLTVSHAGDYVLRVQVTYPESMSGLAIDTDVIQVSGNEVVVEDNNNTPLIAALSVLGGVLAIVGLAFLFAKLRSAK